MHFINAFSICLIYLFLSGCSDGPSSTLQLAEQGLLSGALSDKGMHAVVGSIHHGGSYWDLSSKERLYNWNHKQGEMSSLRAVDISKDGAMAATCQEDTLVLWDTQTGQAKQFWQAEDRIHAIALNDKGDRALLGLRNGSVHYFDLNSGMTIFNFNHQAEVRSVSLSADGSIGMSAGDDNVVKVFNLTLGKEIHSKTLSNQIKTIAISDSGKLAFATAQREDTLVWDIASNEIVFTKENRITNFSAADFSDDESFLSLGTFSGKIIRLDVVSGQQVNVWQADPRQAYGSATSKAIISIRDDGNTILALTSDGMFEIF